MPEAPFDSKIQTMVYNVDVGIGALILRRVSFFIMLGMVCLYYPATHFRGIANDQAFDCMQLGRNLALGRGYVTDVVRPVQLWFTESVARRPVVGLPRVPELSQPPAYPAALGLLFRLGLLVRSPEALFAADTRSVGEFPTEQQLVVPLLELLLIFTALLTYRLARLLFDRRVALTSIWIYFLSHELWVTVLGGTPFGLALFLVTFSAYALVKTLIWHQTGRRERLKWFMLALSALGLAAAGLTYYALLSLWLPWLVVVGFGLRPAGGWAILLGLVIAAAGIGPWAYRNVRAAGVPFGVFGLAPLSVAADVEALPRRALEASLRPDFSVVSTGAVLAKFFTNLGIAFGREAKLIGDGWLMALFVAGLAYQFRRGEVNRFRWYVFGALGTTLFSAAWVGGDGHLGLGRIFYPAVLIYGVAFFFLLLDRVDLRIRLFERLAVFGFVLFNVGGFLLSVFPPAAPYQFPPYSPLHIAVGMGDPALSDARARRGALLLASDLAEGVAWYGNERTLLLPAKMADFTQVNDFVHPISALYVSTRMRNLRELDDVTRGPYGDWAELIRGQVGDPRTLPVDLHLRYVRHPIDMNQMWSFFLFDRPVTGPEPARAGG